MEKYSSDKLDSLIESLLVLNELNVGGQQQDTNDDDVSDGESTDFMDDGDDDNSDTGSDDDVSSGESTDFMDDGDDSNGSSESDDVSDGESTDFMDDGDDTNSEDTSEGGTDDGTGSDDDVSSGESTDFMDDGEDGSGDDANSESGEDGEGEQSEEENQEGEGEEEGEYDINKIEDELFSDLTPEQIAIKNHELKNQFIEIYTIIGSTLVRINDIPKSNDNINILKFVTEKLLELREMVDYNITVAYTTRTYIENNIIYQQCIATLNAIADIIDNIPNVNGGDSNIEKAEKDEEKEELGEPVEPDEEEEQKQLDISDIQTASDYQEESYNYSSTTSDSDINDLF